MGNEAADQYAREAALGHQHSAADGLRWEASLWHLGRVATETRTSATARWITSHVMPERRQRPPVAPGLRRKALRRVRKSLASRYYQLLSGHSAIGSFLHEMTGPLGREPGECRHYSYGEKESLHHLFVEWRAWAPQIRRLWQQGWPGIAGGPSEGVSSEEALEGGGYGGSVGVFSGPLVGSWVSAGGRVRQGIEKSRAASGGRRCRRARRAARGRPRLAVAAFCMGKCTGFLFLCLSFLFNFTPSFVLAGRLKGGKEIGVPKFVS